MCRRKTWSSVAGEWNGILFGVDSGSFTKLCHSGVNVGCSRSGKSDLTNHDKRV